MRWIMGRVFQRVHELGHRGQGPLSAACIAQALRYPELKRAACLQAETFNASVVLIEDKASGTQLIQELVELGLHAVPAPSRCRTRSCACTPRRQ